MSSTGLPNKARLRPDEVADYFNRSRQTVYRWIDEGKIPFVTNPAGRIEILRIDVEIFNQRATEIDILTTSE
jgi:excisionase family DNA binding protein